LNFSREILQSVKESRYSHGEGRRIEWSPSGHEFAVAFERGVVVFGEDSKPKCRLLPQPLTKVTQMCYKRFEADANGALDVLAISTEDGRILFYTTSEVKQQENGDVATEISIADAVLLAQLGGKASGLSGRVKDFEIIPLKGTENNLGTFIITASSAGSIRVWHLSMEDIDLHGHSTKPGADITQVGRLLGSYETSARITCLRAFLMRPARQEEGLSEFEGQTEDGEDLSSLEDGSGEEE